jgi:hypothetical protein
MIVGSAFGMSTGERSLPQTGSAALAPPCQLSDSGPRQVLLAGTHLGPAALTTRYAGPVPLKEDP